MDDTFYQKKCSHHIIEEIFDMIRPALLNLRPKLSTRLLSKCLDGP